VPGLDPVRVRDLDATGSHAEILDLFTGLVGDIDRRTADVVVSVDELDLVEAEFRDRRLTRCTRPPTRRVGARRERRRLAIHGTALASDSHTRTPRV
jgi:hypothetical protein